MKRRRIWEILWVAWLAIFGALEAWAIKDRKPGDTLSETVWRYSKSKPAKVVLEGFLTWLFVHLAFGIL